MKTAWMLSVQQREVASLSLLHRGMTIEHRALGISGAKTFCNILRRFILRTCQFLNEFLPLRPVLRPLSLTVSSLSYSGDKFSLRALATALLLVLFATMYSSLFSGELDCWSFHHYISPSMTHPPLKGSRTHLPTAMITDWPRSQASEAVSVLVEKL